MELHVLPFGRPAWETRRRLLEGIISSRPGPPHDFRDVLYLVPNERNIKTLTSLFLDALKAMTGASGCMPPRFTALNRFMVSRLRQISDLPFLDDITKSLALEEICKKAARGMDGLGPEREQAGVSAAAGISDALDLLYQHGVTDRALAAVASDSLPVELLVRVKSGYESWLKSHGMEDHGRLAASYSPSPEDFREFGTVVLDGFYDAKPAEARLLAALAGTSDCRFVLEAPGLSRPGSAGDGAAYFGTDGLLFSLGAGSPLPGAGADPERDAGLLSAALFEGRALRESRSRIEQAGGLCAEITVVGALNPVEEVAFIGRSIKKALMKGEITDPGRVMLFLAEPASYRPLVEDCFRDLKLPCHFSEGSPLGVSPVVAALVNLMTVPLEGYPFRIMRKVFASPLVVLAEGGNQAGLFDAFGRAEGIVSGRKRWMRALQRASEPLAGPLGRLLELTGRFDRGDARLADWSDAALELIGDAGMEEAVHALDADAPGLADALDRLVSLLGRLRESSALLKGRMGPGEFVYILKREVSRLRCRPEGEALRGVRVLGRLETLSEPFDVIYVAGLKEGALPSPGRQDIFFPPDAAAALGLPSRGSERARDARLFMGLALGAPRVFFCRPQSVDGGPVPPSPYLRALEPFIKAGAIGLTLDESRPLVPGEAMGAGELVRTLALRAAASGDGAALVERTLGPMAGRDAALAAALKAVAAARPVVPPGPHAGCSFTVTELEEYLLCHYRYYQDKVIKSAPAEEPEDDVAPARAGSIVHDILDEFYRKAEGPVTAENAAESLKRLTGIARGKLSTLPDTTRNREFKRRFVEFLAPRFIEAEARLKKTGFRVCETEIPIVIEVDDPDAGHIRLTGKIDRVEIDEGGLFTVVDYKTGGYPGTGSRPLKELFQLPLYALMYEEKQKKEITAAGKKGGAGIKGPAGLVYYNLKDGSMRDVVVYEASREGALATTRSAARKKTAEQMRELIDGSFRAAMEAAAGIVSGRFEPTCDKEVVCQRCVYVSVCPSPAGNGGEETAKGEEG